MFKLEKLEAVLGADMVAKLKRVFDITPETVVEETVVTEDAFVSTTDGMKITGAIEVGSAITSEGAPVADGTYVLDNGNTITVAGSVITEVATKAEEAPEGEVAMSEADVLAAIQNALSVQTIEFNAQIEAIKLAHKNEIKANKEKFEAMIEVVNLVAKVTEAAPAKKDDPKQKYAEKRQSAFNSLLKTIDTIKK